MAITGALSAAVRQDAPFQAEINMGAQLVLDFQGARSGRRPYYWYRGTRYTDPRKIPGWSFTRASVGWAENGAGKLVAFPANEPRITDRGFLIEEARVNKVAIFNANPVTTAGFTLSGDASAVLSVVDDAAGLAAAGLSEICSSGKVFKLDNSAGTTGAIAMATGQVGVVSDHTWSAWIKGGGGAFMRASGDTLGTFTADATVYGRLALTGSGGSTNRTWGIRANSGTVLYFILPQLEEGGFVTSPIVTTGAAATRAADPPYLSSLEAILGVPRTLVGWADLPAADGVIRTIAIVDDGSPNNRTDLRRTNTNALGSVQLVSGTANAAPSLGAGFVGPQLLKGAVRTRATDIRVVFNGALGSSVVTGQAPTVSRLGVGVGVGNSQFLNGYIQRVILLGDVDDTQLQRLTA